jgi:hypothetical protein
LFHDFISLVTFHSSLLAFHFSLGACNLIHIFMMTFPNIDPVIFSIGPLQVRWYGLMYVLGFGASLLLVKHQIKKTGFKELDVHFENLNLAGSDMCSFIIYHTISVILPKFWLPGKGACPFMAACWG